MTKQIDIKELIPFMNDGWVACDENGIWNWYHNKPRKNTKYKLGVDDNGGMITCCFGRPFNIAPAKDWTKSLIKVGGK